MCEPLQGAAASIIVGALLLEGHGVIDLLQHRGGLVARLGGDHLFKGSFGDKDVLEAAAEGLGDPLEGRERDRALDLGLLDLRDARGGHSGPSGKLSGRHPQRVADRADPAPRGSGGGPVAVALEVTLERHLCTFEIHVTPFRGHQQPTAVTAKRKLSIPASSANVSLIATDSLVRVTFASIEGKRSSAESTIETGDDGGEFR